MILSVASFVTAHVHPAMVFGAQALGVLFAAYWFLVWLTGGQR